MSTIYKVRQYPEKFQPRDIEEPWVLRMEREVREWRDRSRRNYPRYSSIHNNNYQNHTNQITSSSTSISNNKKASSSTSSSSSSTKLFQYSTSSINNNNTSPLNKQSKLYSTHQKYRKKIISSQFEKKPKESMDEVIDKVVGFKTRSPTLMGAPHERYSYPKTCANEYGWEWKEKFPEKIAGVFGSHLEKFGPGNGRKSK